MSFFSFFHKYEKCIVLTSYFYGLFYFFHFVQTFIHGNDIDDSECDNESNTESEIELEKDPVQIYLDKNKKTFDSLFYNLQNISQWNLNIDPCLYDSKKYESLLIEETNILENQWKRRILLENTPRGNVIMFYDIYRQAFAYYSDQQIPYSVLNGCAMKYIRIYRCLDFFIDTNILPEGHLSPFIMILEKKEQEEKQKREEKQKKIGIDFKDAPFAKLKTYSKPSSSNSSSPNPSSSNSLYKDSKEKEKNSPVIYKNTFRYLGKVVNFSLLQSTPFTTKISTLEIKENDQVSQKSLAYQSFKKIMRAASIYSKKEK
jgi:hypothetical protein